MTIKTTFGALAVAASAVAFGASTASAQDNPTVGGAPMMADMTIVENAVNSPIHTTLVAAVQQAGLVDTLNSEGPFTVFAPTDDAFGMLSEDSLNALMMDENQEQLAQILTCHVVAAEAFSTAIAGMIADDMGNHPVETVGGCTLQAMMDGDEITLTDENGRTATVTIADVDQSNGVIHVIDRVLLPAGQAG
ncbi:Uncaracterized surface protein containing fasciclin (FAS1) repeats [Roseivivax halotolerans]|uniref:Uncaracterized surface protein containing fasciclin (FAS1) repeats n=1 Tax=Roseivivax halotolerans TaxID=93684 RepID=A0A1I5ZHR4_9RHOB|nr:MULTISPECIES: fasciclin domain-containing protein [Roseivivax]QFT62527.1 Immunogenic protein MPT70 precursor [Roseivivax sp. THAF30]SFQ56029.1 Uncaracterized surface protein containing fasciclin (FAS1) repeats [Roseivivax halotolerans]